MKNITDKKAGGEILENLLSRFSIQVAIFDLDGTMLDNNPFHLQSWLHYLKDKKIEISRDDFNRNVSGRTNKDALEFIFKRKMSTEEEHRLTWEKEAVYRDLYKTHIKEVKGLTSLLQYFKNKEIKMAIATSGIQPNIDFMFEHLPVRHFFSEIVESSQIKNGKPDPEIYLLTAKKLKVSPEHCLVFEDSIPGIQSGKAAGMPVIALTTTHKAEELTLADYVIHDFEDLIESGN